MEAGHERALPGGVLKEQAMPLRAGAGSMRRAAAGRPCRSRDRDRAAVLLDATIDPQAARRCGSHPSRGMSGATDEGETRAPAAPARRSARRGGEGLGAARATRPRSGAYEACAAPCRQGSPDLAAVFVLLARQLAAMRTAMALPDHERRSWRN